MTVAVNARRRPRRRRRGLRGELPVVQPPHRPPGLGAPRARTRPRTSPGGRASGGEPLRAHDPGQPGQALPLCRVPRSALAVDGRIDASPGCGAVTGAATVVGIAAATALGHRPFGAGPARLGHRGRRRRPRPHPQGPRARVPAL